MTPWRAGTLTVHTTPTNAPTVPTRGPTLRTQSAQASSPGPARGSLRAQVTLGADRDGLDNREARKRPMEHAQAPFSCRLDACDAPRGATCSHLRTAPEMVTRAWAGVRATPPWTRQYWSDCISSGSACFRPGRRQTTANIQSARISDGHTGSRSNLRHLHDDAPAGRPSSAQQHQLACRARVQGSSRPGPSATSSSHLQTVSRETSGTSMDVNPAREGHQSLRPRANHPVNEALISRPHFATTHR